MALRALAFALLFAAATVGVGAVRSAVDVYVFHEVEPKFQMAPSAAFQTGLLASGVEGAIGAVVVGLRLGLVRKRLALTPLTVVAALAGGAAFPFLLDLIALIEEPLFTPWLVPPNGVVALNWLALVLYPLLVAEIMLRGLHRHAISERGTSRSSRSNDCAGV